VYCCYSFIRNEKHIRTLEMLYANTDHVSAKYFIFWMLPAMRRGLSFVGYDTMQFGKDVGTFWRNVCYSYSRALKSEIIIVTTVEMSNFCAVFHYCNAITLFWKAAACSVMNRYSLFGRMYFSHHQVIRVSPFGFRARYMLHYLQRNYSSLYVV